MGFVEGIKKSFTQWMRRTAEHVSRRFYEGPEPPPRLFDEVEIFEKMHRGASTEEWRLFVLGAVGNAYRDGYIRGYEHRERMPKDEGYEQQKWLEAEAHRHAFSPWQGQPSSLELRRRFEEQRQDPTAGLSDQQRIAFYEAIAHHHGGFRVIWPGQDDPTPWRKDIEPEA